MLDYQNLLHANFTELSQAVAKWAKLPEAFTKVGTQYDNTVKKGLANSDWEGEAADAALDKIEAVGKQIGAASEEAADIYKLLDDAHEIFTGAQLQLKRLTTDIEEDKYLSIKANGEVWFDPPKDTPTEHHAALNKSYQESIQAYRSSIKKQVDSANEADEILHWALSQDFNGHKSGFDSNTYNSIEGAAKGRAEADKDLKELTKLASFKGQMSVDQLKKFNGTLAQHEGDPYFAEKFATTLGPKGTIEFWTRVADRTQYGDGRTKISAELQKSLSFTLATASHSGSDAMDKWKTGMIDLGSKRVEMVDMNAGTINKGPYGYQVMSSLMRFGEYDKGFLKDYGTHLIDFEKDHGKTKLKELWQPDGYETYLNFGKDEHGKDPMAGYMEALGHNPEAAKEMFHSNGWEKSDGKLDPELKYLLKDRDWPNGNYFAEGKSGYGHEELGHALEAATLGVPYDQPELGLNRDAHTANVMSQVASMVSGDSGIVDDKPGIVTSMAKIGAGYIDDLDWATSNFGDGKDDQDFRDATFNHKGPGHAHLSNETAQNFLSTVGKHEGGYEILSQAQLDYTTSALKAHPNPDEALAKIIETGATTHGILDQARVSDINHAYGEATDEANRKIAEAAEWKKFGVSQGIGLGVGLAVLPFGGPATSAAVAFAVPTIIEGVGGAMETSQGIDIDREVKKQEADFDQKEAMEKGEFANLGRRRAHDPLEAYIAVHPEVEGSQWHRDMQAALRGAYNDGDNETDQTDAD